MARSFREKFEDQRAKISQLEDADVVGALLEFADALDPEYNHAQIPKPTPGGGIERVETANSSAENYLIRLRVVHQRGLDILEADAKTVNDFMKDMVTEPDKRRTDLVEYDGSMSKPSAQTYQSAFRAFYRYCTEPGFDDRPGVAIDWPAEDVIMFRERSDPKHDEEDMPEQEDLDAMRAACIQGMNTRRDRAFLEVAAGTGQRAYAITTLLIKHVDLDADTPHVLLNPKIDGDGDKGAIEHTGRWKPIVSDVEPIRSWIENHPLRDESLRAEAGAPESFEDCHLFVGDPSHPDTDLSSHWAQDSARDMLDRRKADTASMSGVKTVEIPVNPHNWRHYAYTQSQDLPIDESVRRKVFGWRPGSTTGQEIYGHKETETAGREFAEAWADAFEDVDPDSVVTDVLGDIAGSNLDAEARRALVDELTQDDRAVEDLAKAVAEKLEG